MTSASENPEVTVVGAGIVGICCALALVEKGFRVGVIDRAGPAEGASYGNAGVITPWGCVPQSVPVIWRKIPKWLIDPEGPVSLRLGYVPKFIPWALKFLRAGRSKHITATADAMSALSRPSVDLYKALLKNTSHEQLVADCWGLYIYRNLSAMKHDDVKIRLRKERKAPMEFVDGKTLREIEPAISTEYQAAHVIKDQARAVMPGKLGKVLAQKAKSLGVNFTRSSVHAIKPDVGRSWELILDGETATTGKLVIAAGAWSAGLLASVGVRVPLEAERGYHLMFTNPGVSLRHSITDVEATFVVSSMEEGVRSAGTAEFAGINALPQYKRAHVLARLTKRMLPGLNIDDAQEWMGTRPSFPDSLPCIGQVAARPNLYLAFGHGHLGLTMAPKTGRVIADIISNQQPDIDVSPYRAERFS